MKFIIQFEIGAEDLDDAHEIASSIKADAISGVMSVMRCFKGDKHMTDYHQNMIERYALIKLRSVKKLE